MAAIFLKRDVRNGDKINKDDIEMRTFAISRTRSDTVTDISQIEGKSPIRTISANRPIRAHEIAEVGDVADLDRGDLLLQALA